MTLTTTLTRLAPLCVLLAIGCDEQAFNADDSPNQPGDRSTARASVTGTVAAESETDSVTAFRVDADGSLTAVSESTAVADDGSYSVDVNLDADADGALIISDSDGSVDGAVVVNADLSERSETSANTIDSESTTEVRVFLELVADGMTDANGSETGMIDAIISADVGASAQNDDDVDGLADAVLGVLITLNASAEQERQANEASNTQAESELTAHTLLDLGFGEDALSLSIHAAAEATTTHANDSSSTNAEGMLAAELERIRAEIAAQIVEGSSLNIGLSVTGTADVEDNNDGLLGDVLGNLDVGVDLSSSWDEWSESLVVILQTDLSAESRAAMEDADQAATEAEAELEIALTAAFATSDDSQERAEATADAMADFEATVRADARVQALADTDLGEDGAESMTDILLQIHASID